MVLVTYKRKFVRLSHMWFATQEELSAIPKTQKAKADIMYVHGTHLPDPCTHAIKLGSQFSLIKQLFRDPDEVYQTFGKHLRKFIQRSISEGTSVQIYTGTEITDDILASCLRLYNKMKKDKNLSGYFNTALAKQYAVAGNLVVSQACIGDAVVGFKASIVDCLHLRGWVSAFAFREEEFDAQVVSRAHQLLEWETMRYCCQNGITSYDFGGISSFEEPNGIDKFKMTFAKEGEQVTYDNYLVGVSLLGKAIILGYKLMKKIRE